MNRGIALLRMTVGVLFVGHGTQKLFGWFGGEGPSATGRFFERLELRPGRQHALAAGAAEAGGGALLTAGFLTPVGAMLTSSTMATAIRLVHGKKGPWNQNGGFEYNLVLLAAAFAIVDAGPGSFSLDARLGRARWGTRWAVAQLAGALAGSAVAVETGRRALRPSQPVQPEPVAEPRPAPPRDRVLAHA
jgi:putative oxidoreductase